jgi:hypothetical protein
MRNNRNFEKDIQNTYNKRTLIKTLIFKDNPLNEKDVKQLSEISLEKFNFQWSEKEKVFYADDFELSSGRLLTRLSMSPEKDLIISTSLE